MRKNRLQRVFSIALATVMAVGLISLVPQGVSEVEAATTTAAEKDVNLGTGGISDKDFVYYGNYKDNNIKWRVLDADADNTEAEGGMFLLSEYLLEKENVKFDDDGLPNDDQISATEWQHSDAQKWCTSFAENSFTTAEKTALKSVSKDEGEYKNNGWSFGECKLIDESVFYLSVAEVVKYIGETGSDSLKATPSDGSTGFGWWLRTPYTSFNERVACIPYSCYINPGNPDDKYPGVRPAFNLNLDSVLFTSSDNTAKSTFAAVGESNVSDDTWKLTLKDGNTEFSATRANTGDLLAGTKVNVNVDSLGKEGEGVTYDTISGMLTDEAGTVLCYGKANETYNGVGDYSFDIPEGVTTGAHFYVFAEDANQTDQSTWITDYASNMIELTVDSGTCGENATWSLYGNGTLTISGTGAMENYEFNNGIFCENTKIKNVVIEEGITTIGDYAFQSCSALTSATIPDSVITIGECAFWSCSGLTSITIPEKVTTIKELAFYCCSGLTSVTIPKGVKKIGYMTFNECSGLTSVTMTEGLESIGLEAFFGCSSLTSVIIPKSVTEIFGGAFCGNESLTKAIVLNRDVIIGEEDYEVFYNVSSEFKLYGYKGSTTESYANATDPTTDFIALKELTSTMVADISTQYYKGTALTPTIVVKDGDKTLTSGTDYTVAYKDNNKLGTATVIITGIGDYEFSEQVIKTFKIEKIPTPAPVNTVTKGKTYAVDSMKYKVTKAVSGGTGTVTFTGTTKSKKSTSFTVGNTVKINGQTFKVTAISDKAFKNFKKLKKVTIGANVTSIGKEAFSGCKALKTVTIKSKKITKVGKNAIKGVYKKATIKVPGSKVKAYKKLFKSSTGFKKSMKLKK